MTTSPATADNPHNPLAASEVIGGYTRALWISVSIAALALISSYVLKASPQARAR